MLRRASCSVFLALVLRRERVSRIINRAITRDSSSTQCEIARASNADDGLRETRDSKVSRFSRRVVNRAPV